MRLKRAGARSRNGSLPVAWGAGVLLLGLTGSLAAQTPVPPVRPLIGDPTGRSGEPPPLFEEQPREVPAPSEILPPLPPPRPRDPSSLPQVRVFAREIRVVGSAAFTPQQLAAVTAPYTNRNVTAEDLEALRVALTRLYVDRGYVNSGAVLPDQQVTDGVITYQVVEGKLSGIQVEGNRWLRSSYYEKRFALAARPPLDVDSLQERIQLLLEDPRVARLNAELKPGPSPGEALLDVHVEERFPLRLWLDFDNFETPSIGAQRAVATVEHQSLTGNADTLTLSYGRSEGLNPLLDLRYAIPLTASDTTLAIGYRRNDVKVVEEPFDELEIRSDSRVYNVSLWQPVYRTPTTTVALELIGERSSLDTSVLDIPFSLEPGAVDGESVVTVLRFAQEYVQRTRQEVIAARSRFSVGLDALDSTVHADDLPDSQFFAWLAQVQWVRWVDVLKSNGVPDAQFLLRSDLQLTNNPLLTLEQIALGGRYTVRGYPQNTLVRDNAFVASIETRIPIVQNTRWADYVQIAPFFDYGRGWNTDRSTPGPADISGVGIGLRWARSPRPPIPLNAQFEIYWGYPLRDVPTSASALEGDGIQFQFLIGLF